MSLTTPSSASAVARRLRRIEGAHGVQRVMSLHQYLTAAGRTDEVMALFAQRRPEVSAELADWGVFVGLDRVRETVVEPLIRMAAMNGEHARTASGDASLEDRAGMLMESALMTPYVAVSADATSARGLWMAMGAQSAWHPGSERPDAVWTWIQLRVDFVLEDGRWKILHFRVAPRFRTPFEASWAQTAAQGPVKPPPGLVPQADLPPTSATPTDYALDRVPAYDPPIPADYPDVANEAPATDEEAALLRRLERLEDAWAIENLMSRHEYLHAANRNAEEFESCFAHSMPDLSFEPEDWGVWEGPEAVRACYVDGAPPPAPGMLTEHATTTPLVEIAEDGHTAKGVWISPGHETFAAPGAPTLPFWSWGRYGIDFVKIDGQWKFWHFHIYTTFRTPYSINWVDNSVGPRAIAFAEGETPPGMPAPTRPVTANAPYHPDRAPRLLPEPPRPFASFDHVRSFTEPE